MLPTGLTEEEKKYWAKAEVILKGLIQELDNKGFIRTKKDIILDKASFAQMLFISGRINEHLLLTNMLTTVFTAKAQESEKFFLGLNIGFTKANVSTFWMYELFFLFLESTDLFTKNLTLIVIPNTPFWSKMTFGQLTDVLGKECPNFGPKLVSETDVRLRNSIAHNLYWMERKDNGSIELYYTDELGTAMTAKPLQEVLVSIRKQNLLGVCLTSILDEEIAVLIK